MPGDPSRRGSDAVHPSADAVAAPREPAGRVVIRPEHLYKAVALFFLLAFLYRFWDELSYVLLLLYATAIVAVLLNAAVQRLPLSRLWATALLGVIVAGVLGVAAWLGISAIAAELRDLSGRVPDFQAQLASWEEWIRAKTGLRVQLIGPGTGETLRNALLRSGSGLLGSAQGLFEVILVPLLILVGALFATAGPNERLITPALRAVPGDLRPAYRRILELMGDRVVGWLQGTLIDMVCVGALYIVAFSLIGVPNALLLGALNGLLVFVPLIGPWIGGLIAVGVAFLVDPMLALWTALSVIVIQQIEQNLIVPWAFSRAADVHPMITLFALVLFGSLFGFLGLLLAIPLVLLFGTLIQVLWIERTIDTDREPIAPVVNE